MQFYIAACAWTQEHFWRERARCHFRERGEQIRLIYTRIAAAVAYPLPQSQNSTKPGWISWCSYYQRSIRFAGLDPYAGLTLNKVALWHLCLFSLASVSQVFWELKSHWMQWFGTCIQVCPVMWSKPFGEGWLIHAHSSDWSSSSSNTACLWCHKKDAQ